MRGAAPFYVGDWSTPMPYSPTSSPQFREIEQRANANGCTLRYTAGEYRLSHTETASVVYADDSLENVRGWLAYRPDLRGQHEASTAV